LLEFQTQNYFSEIWGMGSRLERN